MLTTSITWPELPWALRPFTTTEILSRVGLAAGPYLVSSETQRMEQCDDITSRFAVVINCSLIPEEPLLMGFSLKLGAFQSKYFA
jgi:hypothetical protein